jgi:uncharacterized protein YdiU (UPF0061 family)
LHQTRKFRNIKTDDFLQGVQRKLIDWNLENNTQRGRCVTIQMRCTKIKRLLEEQLKAITNYILTEYSEELKMSVGVARDKRENAVKYILEPFHKLDHRLQTVLMMAEILTKDLDQAKWAVRYSIDILAIVHGNE